MCMTDASKQMSNTCWTLSKYNFKILGKKVSKTGGNCTPKATVGNTLEMSQKHSQSMQYMHAKKIPNMLNTLKNC